MTNATTPIATVLDQLFDHSIALRPHWYQPGAPRECWLLVDRGDGWLIVWDPTVRRVEHVARYAAEALRETLPRLANAHVFNSSIVDRASADPALCDLARAFVERRERTLDALREDHQRCARTATHPRATAHLFRSPDIGWKEVVLDSAGALVRHTPISEDHARSSIEAALFAGRELEVEPAAIELLAALERGERRYLALCAQLRGGAIGWAVHVGLLVIEVDARLYNTAFSGDEATSITVFRPEYLQAEMLTRSTLSDQRPAPVKPLSAAQHASARTLVAKRSMTAEQLFAKIEAGALSIAGGGPTSEDRWSIGRASDGTLEQRFATGEVEPRTREEVLAILARQGYSSMTWR